MVMIYLRINLKLKLLFFFIKMDARVEAGELAGQPQPWTTLSSPRTLYRSHELSIRASAYYEISQKFVLQIFSPYEGDGP
jgi:hypothetical protein